MGVVSTIVDEDVFVRMVRRLMQITKPDGWLITKDLLHKDDGERLFHDATYATKYRSRQQYEAAFSQVGFGLVGDRKLAETEHTVNHIFLWRKPPR